MPRVIITVPGSNPQPYLFQLDRKSVTFGRGSINDIVVDCGSVSVKHAEMRRVEGGYELRDVGSTNGLKVDGETREMVPLHDGDTVRMGDVVLEFKLSADELEVISRERPLEESPIIREPVGRMAEEAVAPDTAASHEPQPAEAPAAKRKTSRQKPVPASTGLPQGGQFGCIWLFATLLVAAIAFGVGMMLRYERGTGESWFKSVKERFMPAQPSTPDPKQED